MPMGTSNFPTFDSERSLVRALKRQGFVVGDRTASGATRIENPLTGAVAFLHMSSVTSRSGNSQRNALKSLAAIGFRPPAEFEKERRLERKEEALARTKEPEPTPEPTPEPPDPSRAFPCVFCAEERCPRCADAVLPCAFERAVHLGRHTSTRHAPKPGETAKALVPEKKRKQRGVTTRVEPNVISDPLLRRLVSFEKALAALVLEASDLADAIRKRVEKDGEELRVLRDYQRRMEARVGKLFDEATKPPR